MLFFSLAAVVAAFSSFLFFCCFISSFDRSWIFLVRYSARHITKHRTLRITICMQYVLGANCAGFQTKCEHKEYVKWKKRNERTNEWEKERENKSDKRAAPQLSNTNKCIWFVFLLPFDYRQYERKKNKFIRIRSLRMLYMYDEIDPK